MRVILTVLLAAWVCAASSECVAACFSASETATAAPPCHRHSPHSGQGSQTCVHPPLVGIARDSVELAAISPVPVPVVLRLPVPLDLATLEIPASVEAPPPISAVLRI